MEAIREQENGDILALDIGTRSIIGVLGRVEGEKFHVLAIEKANHGQRAMLDGQIENIEQVAAVARTVMQRLENRTRIRLSRVCVAAAGRALKSEQAGFTMELAGTQQITEEVISQLEAGAVSEAEKRVAEQSGQQSDQYYMVGYTVVSYRLDGYPMSSIRDHSGRVLEADVVAVAEVEGDFHVTMCILEDSLVGRQVVPGGVDTAYVFRNVFRGTVNGVDGDTFFDGPVYVNDEYIYKYSIELDPAYNADQCYFMSYIYDKTDGKILQTALKKIK